MTVTVSWEVEGLRHMSRRSEGSLASDSEYIRELIRRDQEENIKLQALKSAIQEGLASGGSDKTVPQIMEEVEARLRADGRIWAVTESGNRSRLQRDA